MIIKIEPQSDIPIYTQLTNQIIEGIAKGEIQAGESLPSVRSFAADLGVNMHTVNKSYHQLEAKGIIKIIPKSGAVISSPTQSIDTVSQRMSGALRSIIAEALVSGLEREQIQELVSSIMNDLNKKE
ncbi:GntR family transcriptional regulator [Bacillus dakarensis]|uniref:GntR family transcriptional regulator n=1 Tax=Robertmurraya dakarensis TaxID=1926278 RepID=UPI0009817784|nr:GntR family transcriptional regulator [Bacillus dakarensis]